jgi:hypothetical protein
MKSVSSVVAWIPCTERERGSMREYHAGRDMQDFGLRHIAACGNMPHELIAIACYSPLCASVLTPSDVYFNLYYQMGV